MQLKNACMHLHASTNLVFLKLLLLERIHAFLLVTDMHASNETFVLIV